MMQAMFAHQISSLVNLVIGRDGCLSCVLFYTQQKVRRGNLSLLSVELQLSFSNGPAVSDTGSARHPRGSLMAVDGALVTSPLMVSL